MGALGALFVFMQLASFDTGGAVLQHTTEQQHPTAGANARIPQRSFPRWQHGIDFSILLDFIQGVVNKTATIVLLPKARARFPETPYIIDDQGIWVSRTIRNRGWNMMLTARTDPTEELFRRAWQRLKTETVRWKRLRRQVVEQQGFPFIVWYGDYKSCNYRNWQERYSIPLLTTCAGVNCSYAFPIPNYRTYTNAQASTTNWTTIMNEYSQKYPWNQKENQLVWRGSLSAATENSTRWRLAAFATTSPSASSSSLKNTRLNVGLTSVPARYAHLNASGRLKEPIQPMEDFQRYRGILDVDGNSWSSRFGKLLCFNSVVVKVEPAFVDYFHSSTELQPWKQYIPVREDLSDLLAVAGFVTDPQNEQQIVEIVARANEWCRSHMTHRALAEDLLDILQVYVSHLDEADPDWTGVWKERRRSLFAKEFDMVLL